MQKMLLPLAFLAISLTACSQENYLDKFYNKHHNSGEGAGSLFSPSFSINANFSGDSQKTWKNKVTQFRMLILDSKENPSLRHDLDELSLDLRKDKFEDMVTIHSGKDNMQLLSKDEKGGLKEIVFVVTGKDGGCVFMDIKGKFTAHDMDEIQSSLQDNNSKGITIN